MIILDTNVISALMSQTPEIVVQNWLDRQPRISVWTTSITIFEIRFGLNLMPAGKRREQLEQAFERLCGVILENRIAEFGASAAYFAAEIQAGRKQSGSNVEMRDTMIAGTARASGATLATRNVRDFQSAGIDIVDPWKSAA